MVSEVSWPNPSRRPFGGLGRYSRERVQLPGEGVVATTLMLDGTLDELRNQLRGPAIAPGDADYDAARIA